MPSDPRKPIYNLKHLYFRFDSGETHIRFTLESVWPRREVFNFRATATDDKRGDAYVGWLMYVPGHSGGPGWFDPTLRLPLMTDGEQYAFTFAAHLVHEIVACGDVVVTAPRGLTDKAIAKHMDALKSGMDTALLTHLNWFIEDATRVGDVTAGPV